MREPEQRPRLADRTEAILRSDRSAFQRVRRQPGILLTLVPESGAVIDFMDAYMPMIAEMAGLQYVRMIGSEHREIAGPIIERTYLVLADLSGGDEHVIRLVKQALEQGRRVMLAARAPGEIPGDLSHVRHVLYDLNPGAFDALLRAVKTASCSVMDDFVFLT